MVMPYQTARFKSANILTIAILGSFNFCQYFRLYGICLKTVWLVGDYEPEQI